MADKKKIQKQKTAKTSKTNTFKKIKKSDMEKISGGGPQFAGISIARN